MSEFWMVKYFPSYWNESKFLFRQWHKFTTVLNGTVTPLLSSFSLLWVIFLCSTVHFSLQFYKILHWGNEVLKLYKELTKSMSRKRSATYLYERIGPPFLVFSPAPDQALPERTTKTKQKAQEDTKANPENITFSHIRWESS